VVSREWIVSGSARFKRARLFVEPQQPQLSQPITYPTHNANGRIVCNGGRLLETYGEIEGGAPRVRGVIAKD
jgi:hypothetical protein